MSLSENVNQKLTIIIRKEIFMYSINISFGNLIFFYRICGERLKKNNFYSDIYPYISNNSGNGKSKLGKHVFQELVYYDFFEKFPFPVTILEIKNKTNSDNGKSKIKEACNKALGNYVCKFPVTLFTEKESNKTNSNYGLVKEIIGESDIQMRPLYDENASFSGNLIFKSLMPSIDEINTRFIEDNIEIWSSIQYGLMKLNYLTYEELVTLKENIIFYGDYISKHISIYNRPFYEDIVEIDKKINVFGGKKFKTPIKMSASEKVNGYELYSVCYNVISYDDFNEYHKIWNKINDNILDILSLNLPLPYDIIKVIALKSDMSDEEFIERFEKEACSDWSKQDRYGNCYGGYWDYPEGSYERENAYDLSREDNLKGLLELPYPREFILKTIEIGCGNRRESVRYTNFLCEWMKRKIESMK